MEKTASLTSAFLKHNQLSERFGLLNDESVHLQMNFDAASGIIVSLFCHVLYQSAQLCSRFHFLCFYQTSVIFVWYFWASVLPNEMDDKQSKLSSNTALLLQKSLDCKLRITDLTSSNLSVCMKQIMLKLQCL